MTAASTSSSVAYIFKTTYATGLGDEARRRHPLAAMIKKQGGFVGTQFEYPCLYSNAQGVSGTLANAQTAASSTKGVRFAATRKKKYGVVTIDGESLRAAASPGAFVDLVTLETDKATREIESRLAFDLYRDGSGNRGQRASASTNVITLATANDARNFEPGMTVVASSSAAGTGPRTGSTTVVSVDIDGGTITLTSAAAITSFSDNDYLFGFGENALCMEGLESGTPATAPASGDSFRGVDRSVYPIRLAGSRLADTTDSIERGAGRVAVKIDDAGGQADTLMLSPLNFFNVASRLNAKVEYDGAGGEATFGFERILIATAAGTLKCYSDPDCPTNVGRVFNAASHYIRTLDEYTHIIMDDGRPDLRATADDAIEARIRHMGNYIQMDTRDHGRFTI